MHVDKKKNVKKSTTVTVAQNILHMQMCHVWLAHDSVLEVLHILGFCDADETEQGAYSVPYGLECCTQLMHAMGAANGKCLQAQVQGWVSTCNVM